MQILGPSPPLLPSGISDYVQLRRAGCTYVDKTGFIAQVLGTQASAQLYPRPRRFGKTLNLSTLRWFLERPAAPASTSPESGRSPAPPPDAPDLTDLFTDTEIWTRDGGAWRAHFQRYPVIFLTFKDVKQKTWAEAWATIRELVQDELSRLRAHHDLDARLDAESRQRLAAAADFEATPAAVGQLLGRLSRWCHARTGEPVVILIDEYDAALLTAWQYRYWDEAISFFRAFLGAGLKDNPHLFRGVLTGILRVAKEGIFSGLNNVETYGILSARAATCFGFTEPEVTALVEACGLADQLPDITTWYNGYRFGGAVPHTIYNPWSLLQFLRRPMDGLLPYWKNTSANDLIHALLLRHADTAGPLLERLLAGERITVTVDENVALNALERSPTALWSLLLFSGYLTAEGLTTDEHGVEVTVRLPNREVAQVYRSTFLTLLGEPERTQAASPVARALLGGDAQEFGRLLGEIFRSALSYHDFGRRPVEAVYHAFVVGLLVHLEPTHRVRSNRESGYGRADVLVLPRAGGPGAVLELKVVQADEDETPAQALQAAAAQLRDRQYHTEVRAAGATTVHQFAVVFDGKRCWVEPVPEAA